jgi:phosphatidylserine/phosphatidylglycerophosphate/cardiolipin synthase-like enzyme
MKKLIIITSLIFLQLFTTQFLSPLTAQEKPPVLNVYFSPNGGSLDAILNQLISAKKTIFIHAYEITSPKIEKEIVKAHRRDLKIEIIIDHTRSTSKDSMAIFLFKQGVSVLTDKKHPKSHNKVIIIDREFIITGSYNFTKAAEKNAENVIIIMDPKIAEIYIKNFKEHAEHSKPFTPKEK